MTAQASAFQPSHECDLVLKGGVTSGIVYPAAIARIAKDYRFRAVGGTSAGAIGAAAAAAMEFGRRSARNPVAPAMLAALSEELAEDHDGSPLLQRLFEPEPDNERLFTRLMKLAAIKRARGVAGAALHILLPPLGLAMLVASILVAGLFALSARPTGIATGIALALLFLFATLVMLVAFLILDWAPVVSNELKAAGTHGFGFCSGKAQHRTASGTRLPSLSGWLHDKFQTLAGLDDESPLCFGDLWIAEHRTTGRNRAEAMIAAGANKDRMETMDPVLDLLQRDIELALVASDITRAQSVQLPFMRREDRLYARISDLKGLFPDVVVDWMIAHARTSDLAGVTLGDIDPANLIRLPAPENLPILFAVRMSLSFPFLFRAVRLYIIRHRPGGTQALSELWLADGGITSNFPIHLFDAPIPTRPTFCLNLLSHDDELEPDERGANPAGGGTEQQSDGLTMDTQAPPEELVYMLRSNRGRVSAYTPLPSDGRGALLKFAGRIVTTARQWGDNQLIDVPGYRDRIVHIRMRKNEGGFNFDMDASTIDDLQARGEKAGAVIAERFLPGTLRDPLRPKEKLVLNWANHRMVRFRSFLAGLEVAASRFTTGWTTDLERGESPTGSAGHIAPSIEEMIDVRAKTMGKLAQPTGYPFSNDEQATLAHDMVEQVNALTERAARNSRVGIDFVNGQGTSPRPKPALKLRAPSDTDARAERPAS